MWQSNKNKRTKGHHLLLHKNIKMFKFSNDYMHSYVCVCACVCASVCQINCMPVGNCVYVLKFGGQIWTIHVHFPTIFFPSDQYQGFLTNIRLVSKPLNSQRRWHLVAECTSWCEDMTAPQEDDVHGLLHMPVWTRRKPLKVKRNTKTRTLCKINLSAETIHNFIVNMFSFLLSFHNNLQSPIFKQHLICFISRSN